jgi:hypothetical protein
VKFTQPVTAKLADLQAERVRINTDRRIGELQALPITGATVLAGIQLPTSTDVFVPHGLGREPSMVIVSPPYPIVLTSGGIFELRGVSSLGGPIDRSQAIVLRAFDWGITVTVDVMVF